MTRAQSNRSRWWARSAGLRLKRAFDIVGASSALAATSPLLAGLTLLELRVHGWPPWFTQPRPGFQGKAFRIHKFRTMTDACDSEGQLLPDAQRLTRFGDFLRSTSLDELPELLNVLKGEMSLVGPRPLMMQYLDRYTPEQMRRHEMPPGITGWAQVHGRNAISWEERFKLDVWYVDHWRLRLDLRVLLLTAWKVIRREGIAAEGAATMPEFMGTAASDAETDRPDLPSPRERGSPDQ